MEGRKRTFDKTWVYRSPHQTFPIVKDKKLCEEGMGSVLHLKKPRLDSYTA